MALVPAFKVALGNRVEASISESESCFRTYVPHYTIKLTHARRLAAACATPTAERPGGLDGWPVPATRVIPPRREQPSLRRSALRVRRPVLARGVLPAEVAPVPGIGAPVIARSLRPGATEQV